MRTTVTLDHEAERLVREAMRRHGRSFEQTLDRAVLRGLADLEVDADEPPFEIEGSAMHLRAGHDPAGPNKLGDELEAEAFVALTASLIARDERG